MWTQSTHFDILSSLSQIADQLVREHEISLYLDWQERTAPGWSQSSELCVVTARYHPYLCQARNLSEFSQRFFGCSFGLVCCAKFQGVKADYEEPNLYLDLVNKLRPSQEKNYCENQEMALWFYLYSSIRGSQEVHVVTNNPLWCPRTTLDASASVDKRL